MPKKRTRIVKPRSIAPLSRAELDRLEALPPGTPDDESPDLAAAGTDRISLRIDRDVLTWFRRQGPRYQTLLKHALRDYMRRQSSSQNAEVVELRPLDKGQKVRGRFLMRKVG